MFYYWTQNRLNKNSPFMGKPFDYLMVLSARFKKDGVGRNSTDPRIKKGIWVLVLILIFGLGRFPKPLTADFAQRVPWWPLRDGQKP